MGDADARPQSDATPNAFLSYLESGSHSGPFMGGAIGTAFLTPDQETFRAARLRYGESELDAGSYFLNQIKFNKETGTASVGMLDVGPSSWYGEVSPNAGV